MIVLYILSGLLAVILLLLFSDVSLVLTYNTEFSFRIRYLFVSLDAEKIAKLSSSKKDTSHEDVTELKKKHKSLSNLFDLLLYIVDLIKAVLGQLVKYARIKICRINVSVATDDAAKTALLFGAVSGAIYSILEFFDTFLLLKKNYKKISVNPDFSSENSSADIKIILKIKPIHALLALLHLAPVLVKERK